MTTSTVFRHLYSSSDNAEINNAKDVSRYLEGILGIDPKLHRGILKAIESVHGKDVRVSHLVDFGETTMKALAASVERELRRRSGMEAVPSIPLRIKVPHHRYELDVEWKLGDSLLDLAKEREDVLGEYMEGTCGGQMSCCTCHVYIAQPEFQSYLKEPEEAELDMLDLAYSPTGASRLGCQVRLTRPMLNPPVQLEVEIPCGVNNVWN
jgi:ferredoxin